MERKGPRILRHCAAERLGVVRIMNERGENLGCDWPKLR